MCVVKAIWSSVVYVCILGNVFHRVIDSPERTREIIGDQDTMITYLKIRKTNEVTESTTASARSAGIPTIVTEGTS
jgi:hypothetical protein